MNIGSIRHAMNGDTSLLLIFILIIKFHQKKENDLEAERKHNKILEEYLQKFGTVFFHVNSTEKLAEINLLRLRSSIN